MICVTLGRGRHSSLIAEWKAAAEAGAELVELRLDCLRREPDLARLLKVRHTPLVLTIRRAADGGLWRADEGHRQQLLREAIVKGVDYVDLESDVAATVPRFGTTRRIVSYHNMRKTPNELNDLWAQMAAAQADVVKVATLAQSVGDAARVLELVAKADVPTVGIAMGSVGFFTRVLGAKYGAPFTFAGFNPDRTFAPGMPSFRELKKDYQYDSIDRETEVYAVIGDPIAQSLSPAIHNAAFRHVGLNKVYVPIQVPTGRAKETLQELSWLDIKGFSVTIPHKEAVARLLAQADGAVEKTGSCNTVVVKDGQWLGYNTDYRAAMQSLEEAFGGTPGGEEESHLLDKQALVLGAGGVARTIAYGLSRRGAGVTVTGRDDEKAQRLAEEIGCRSVTWSMRAGTLCDALINCTPVGMFPKVDDTPVPPAAFHPKMVVFDTVYHPENTMFVKLARERDCITVTGVDMFVRQAAEQFRLFTGYPGPTEVMREVISRKLGALRDD